MPAASSWTKEITARNGNNSVLSISFLLATSHCSHQDSSLRFSCWGFNSQIRINNQHLKEVCKRFKKKVVRLCSAIPFSIFISLPLIPSMNIRNARNWTAGLIHFADSTPLKFHCWADTALGNMTQCSTELNSQGIKTTYRWHFKPKNGDETWTRRQRAVDSPSERLPQNATVQ